MIMPDLPVVRTREQVSQQAHRSDRQPPVVENRIRNSCEVACVLTFYDQNALPDPRSVAIDAIQLSKMLPSEADAALAPFSSHITDPPPHARQRGSTAVDLDWG